MKRNKKGIAMGRVGGGGNAVARAIHRAMMSFFDKEEKACQDLRLEKLFLRLSGIRTLMPFSTPAASAVFEEGPFHKRARDLGAAWDRRRLGMAPHPDLLPLCGQGLHLHDFSLESIVPVDDGTLISLSHPFGTDRQGLPLEPVGILLSGRPSESWLAGGIPSVRLRKGEALENRTGRPPFLRPVWARACDRADVRGPLPPILCDEPHLSTDGRPAIAIAFGQHRFEALFSADSVTVLRGRGAIASVVERDSLGRSAPPALDEAVSLFRNSSMTPLPEASGKTSI